MPIETPTGMGGRPYKPFEHYLNTICIPCVLETHTPICIPFLISRPCKGHAPRKPTNKKQQHMRTNTTQPNFVICLNNG